MTKHERSFLALLRRHLRDELDEIHLTEKPLRAYVVSDKEQDGKELDIRRYRDWAFSICHELLTGGYITERMDDTDGIYVALTQRGRRYREIQWEEVKSFLLKSVVVPILVSALTALLTLWIASFFS